MSTRSNICRQNTDGSYDVIYCHFDGYPSGVGKVLYEYYQEPTKIAELLKLGDLSILGGDIGRKVDFEKRYKDKAYRETTEGQCLAYGRDRGEEGTEAM